MITLVCAILFLAMMGNLIGLAVKMTWGLTKILLTVVFWPFILLVVIFTGAFYLAIPLLLITGCAALIKAVVV